MNEDCIADTARNIGGKLEEGVGRATRDIKGQVQGELDQAAGTAPDLYGQTAEVARDTAVTFEKWLRDRSPGPDATVPPSMLWPQELLGGGAKALPRTVAPF